MGFNNIETFRSLVGDEQNCLDILNNLRFRENTFCPYCNQQKVYQYACQKRYRCSSCKKDFNVRTGTVFGNSRIPLSKWYEASFLLSTTRKKCSTTYLSEELDVTQKTAWYIKRRLIAQHQNVNTTLNSNDSIRPFLKWVGGKRSILSELIDSIPMYFAGYYEPFVGGGALFFKLQPKTAYLSDTNPYLINTFTIVRDDVDSLISDLEILEKRHSQNHYYWARKQLHIETNRIMQAAIFIYLNKTCFNGLYRVNSKGEFNVAYGYYDNPTIFERDVLLIASDVLQNATIRLHSFEETPIREGALYYFDPPYYLTYDGYSHQRFDRNQHIILSKFCKKIHDNGAFFLLSNADKRIVRGLYKNFHKEVVTSSRSISRDVSKRGKTQELLIRNYTQEKFKESELNLSNFIHTLESYIQPKANSVIIN